MRNSKRKYDFYFTHNPYFTQNLFRILKTGYIQLGKDLPVKYRALGGEEPLREIYGNIYFDDIGKKQIYWGPMIIINPNILEDYDFGYRFGWKGYELKVNVSDSNKIFWNKIDMIHNILKFAKLKYYLGNGESTTMTLNDIHEIVFRKKIPVDKYISAIRCDFLSDKEMIQIKKIIAAKHYNIKLIKREYDSTLSKSDLEKRFKVLKSTLLL